MVSPLKKSIAKFLLFIVWQFYPSFIGPVYTSADSLYLAADAGLLQFPESRFAGFQVQEGQQIAAVVQQELLHIGHGHLVGVLPGLNGQRGQGTGSLAQAHHNRLQAGSPVHLPRGGDGFIGHQKVLHLHRYKDTQGHAERRDLPIPKVG